MKVHLLQQGRSVSLPAQLLLVRVQRNATQRPTTTPGPLPQLEAVVVSSDGREAPATEAEGSAGSLVLGVSEPTTIRLRPAVGVAVFGPDSSFSISIGGDNAEADRVVLSSVDAAGLRQRDLVTVAPVGDEIVVTAVGDTWEVELPPAAARARSAARAVLADWDLPDDQAVLNVVVDVSASMLPYTRVGALERVIELLMGATQGISSSPRVTGSLCGQSRVAIGEHDLTSFAATISARAARQPHSIGFRSRTVPQRGDRDITYLLTDAVPADLDPTRTDQLHLVILSGSRALAPPRLPATVGVTVVPVVVSPGVVSPAVRDSVVADFVVDEGEEPQLRDTVASLLSPYRRRFEGGRR